MFRRIGVQEQVEPTIRNNIQSGGRNPPTEQNIRTAYRLVRDG